MAEWSIAAVLKTVELRGSGGSNPSLSAKEMKAQRSWAFLFSNIICQALLEQIILENKKKQSHCFHFFVQLPLLGIT